MQKSIEQPIGRLLTCTGRKYLNHLNAKLGQLDIDRNFYALILIEAGNGTITQQELANQLDTDKVSIVRIIDYLSTAGYVKRDKHPEDRRKYSLVLTNKAKQKINNIKKAVNDSTKVAFKGLEPRQISDFYNTIYLIKKNLDTYNSDL